MIDFTNDDHITYTSSRGHNGDSILVWGHYIGQSFQGLYSLEYLYFSFILRSNKYLDACYEILKAALLSIVRYFTGIFCPSILRSIPLQFLLIRPSLLFIPITYTFTPRVSPTYGKYEILKATF